MKSALIGFSGFVGENILQQHQFTDLYNSRNIDQIRGQSFDLVVSCGTSSLFWKANLEPVEDMKKIQLLIDALKEVKAKKIVLISTIFVYPDPYKVDEETLIDETKLSPYGFNRYQLEKFVIQNFSDVTIIRLPNLFGIGLKKNFIYDLLNNNRLDLTHKDSLMQWYDLKNIWKDIQISMKNNLNVVNFAVEPIKARNIAKDVFGLDFQTVTQKPPLNHKMLSKYSAIFGGQSGFLYSKKDVLSGLIDLKRINK